MKLIHSGGVKGLGDLASLIVFFLIKDFTTNIL